MTFQLPIQLNHFDGLRLGLFLRFFFHFLSLFFLTLQDVWRDELDELFVEDIQDFAAQKLQLVSLAGQVVVEDIDKRVPQALVLRQAELDDAVTLDGDLVLFLGAVVVVFLAKERALECEGIHDVHFLEHDYSGCRQLAFLNSEPAVFKTVEVIFLATQQRYDAHLSVLHSALLLIVLVAAPEEESIVLSGVTVQIAKQEHLPLEIHYLDELLRVEDCWVQEAIRFIPLPIQVAAKQRASVVTVNHPVRVQHGHDAKNEVFSELLGFAREQIVEDAIQHMRRLWLTWVDPARDDYSLLLAVVLNILQKPLPEASESRTGS